ncbi:MAG: hypothetical protein ABUT20_01180 [Bacteroidota bacterium]
MKKAALFAAIVLMFSAVNAQEAKPAVTSPTVDSIAAKYKLQPMPEAIAIDQVFPVIGEYQPSAMPMPATTDATATPAPATTEAAPAVVSNLKITLDDQNKGLVWIEGLPQGKVKAMLRKSPSTYKIPAQKTAEGNDVKEGTMIYDKDTKIISISLGKAYNDADPAAAFAPAPAVEEPVAVAPKAKKGKKVKAMKPVVVEKPFVFVGTKIEHTNAVK